MSVSKYFNPHLKFSVNYFNKSKVSPIQFQKQTNKWNWTRHSTFHPFIKLPEAQIHKDKNNLDTITYHLFVWISFSKYFWDNFISTSICLGRRVNATMCAFTNQNWRSFRWKTNCVNLNCAISLVLDTWLIKRTLMTKMPPHQSNRCFIHVEPHLISWWQTGGRNLLKSFYR